MLHIQYRPMVDTSWCRDDDARKPSQFSADWHSTMRLLEREVTYLEGEDVTMQLDIPERSIYADGSGIKAKQSPASPAVVLSFESVHGTLTYRADALNLAYWRRGDAWRQNVRAVALTLESLRAVDRYGATPGGEQYTGFKALNAGRAMPASHMTTEEACQVIAAVSWPNERRENREGWAPKLATDADMLAREYKRARAFAHPDRRGGDRTLWDKVEEAAQALGVG